MRRSRRSSRGSSSSRPVRGVDWGGYLVASTGDALVSSMARWYLDPLDARANFVDPTVVRHLWTPACAIHGAVSSTGYIAQGLIAWDWVDNTVPAAGQYPTPAGDPEMDWIARWVVPVFFQASGRTTYTDTREKVHDISTMRRLGNTKGLLWVAQSVNIGSGNVDQFSDIRYLLKE